ncbi:hypothetical protein [Paenibacillus eucommiae]|uniref:Sporulation protein n=1 Tax=Paenibacillus eucommiae TaxID=1355755 RepID=A0ABS4J6S3_9BACL|nr:hypothetical protein [Paenibacillus eucommiae]MBP1994975.1 hypothetical protein [Paenibacillus eucommiae]
MSKRFLGLIAGVLLLSGLMGCSSGVKQKSQVKPYPEDGYMGLTSVNPNFPLNPTYHHYQDDASLMKAVLAQFPEIKHSQLTIRGPIVDVKLQYKDGLSPSQIEQVKSAAYMALKTNMPRYTIHM